MVGREEVVAESGEGKRGLSGDLPGSHMRKLVADRTEESVDKGERGEKVVIVS